jgi:hypothetical protein
MGSRESNLPSITGPAVGATGVVLIAGEAAKAAKGSLKPEA